MDQDAANAYPVRRPFPRTAPGPRHGFGVPAPPKRGDGAEPVPGARTSRPHCCAVI